MTPLNSGTSKVPLTRVPKVRRVQYLSLAAVLLLWQITSWVFFSNSLFLTGPLEIVMAVPGTWGDAVVLEALFLTTIEFLVAFGMAAGAGILLGAALGATQRFFKPTRNLLQTVFAFPQVAIYPLLALWLGLGAPSKVAFGFSHGIFPVVLGTMAATKLVDRGLIDAIRAMGGGSVAVVWKAVIPSILPDIVSSLRFAAALTLLGVLLAEMMISVGGVGAILHTLSASFEPDRLYALVATIAAAAILVNMAIGALEKRLSTWRP